MRLSEERKISIYLYIVLLVNQSGVQLPFLNFMTGNNQIILAGILLFIGLFLFYKRKRLSTHSLGMKFFWWLLAALVLSVFMAYLEWKQDFTTCFLLYRHHIWIFFLPLLFYIKPSVKSISNALFAFTLTALFVCLGQIIGLFPPPIHETITGVIMDGTNEFGGYGIVGARLVTFSLYMFLGEMALKFSRKNIIKVLIALIAVVLTAQRSLLLFALPITAFVFLFKVKLSAGKKIAISLLFLIIATIFFVNTSEIWLSFLTETTDQLNDTDYNRWLAFDYFFNKYSNGLLPLILGNGFLSLKNAGGQLIYNLGYSGIFIDDIGMVGVWVRYGIIPFIVLYYIVVNTLRSKTIPFYLKLMCIHIGFLPISWTLIGPHYFVFIFLIYLYCLNKDLLSKNVKFV